MERTQRASRRLVWMLLLGVVASCETLPGHDKVSAAAPRAHVGHPVSSSDTHERDLTSTPSSPPGASLPDPQTVSVQDLQATLASSTPGIFCIAVYDSVGCKDHLRSFAQAALRAGGICTPFALNLTDAAVRERAARAWGGQADQFLGQSLTSACRMVVWLTPFESRSRGSFSSWMQVRAGAPNARSLQAAAARLFPESLAVHLTGPEFSAWLEKGAPRVKVVLFSVQDRVAPMLLAAAGTLHDHGVDFGVAPPGDALIAQYFNVTEGPVIFAAYPDPRAPSAAPIREQYRGPFSYLALTTWVVSLTARFSTVPDDLWAHGVYATLAPRLGGKQDWEDACAPGPCALAVLPGGPAYAESVRALRAMRQAAAQELGRATRSARYAWLDAGRHPRLAASLLSGRQGEDAAPALIVLDLQRRRRATVVPWDWTTGAVLDCVDDFLAGKGVEEGIEVRAMHRLGS
ncbi:hypothetical protein ACKKBG_A06360 [Auxenochlorella protothecoides x Auxenochlorella symbiontica]